MYKIELERVRQRMERCADAMKKIEDRLSGPTIGLSGEAYNELLSQHRFFERRYDLDEAYIDQHIPYAEASDEEKKRRKAARPTRIKESLNI